VNTNSNSSNASDDQPSSILIVEDDDIFRQRLARAMTDRGLEVRTASDAPEALVEARKGEPPELAVVDLRMPGGSGLDVVRELKALEPAMRILVLTGYGSIVTAVEAIKLGATNYLTKPADADDILNVLQAGSGDAAQPSHSGLAPPSLARTEWEHIQRVLADCGGNISEAARRLGLHRRSLQRKLGKNPPRT
jgi:two-component system response regulator RegA